VFFLGQLSREYSTHEYLLYIVAGSG